jgi:hypothetical protein
MTEGLVQAEEDLAVLLEHVGSDRRPAARAEMARSADIRAFLEIGVELLVGDLLQHAGPDPDGASPAAVLFRGLSRQRLVEKGAALRAAGRLAGTTTSESQFKDRWRYADRYTEDLIAYLFRLDLYRAHLQDVRAALAGELAGASLGRVVDLISEQEVQQTAYDPLVALQALLQRALPNHPKVTAHARALYDELLPEWARVYEALFARYGLALAPGHTWLDVAELFNTVVEGSAQRILADDARVRLSNGCGILAASVRLMIASLASLPPGTSLDELHPVAPS